MVSGDFCPRQFEFRRDSEGSQSPLSTYKFYCSDYGGVADSILLINIALQYTEIASLYDDRFMNEY